MFPERGWWFDFALPLNLFLLANLEGITDNSMQWEIKYLWLNIGEIFPFSVLVWLNNGLQWADIIHLALDTSSHPEVFLWKSVLKICSKFTGEHPCRSAISIKLQSNFIESTLRHGCSPVNLLNIFRTRFPKNTSARLLPTRFRTWVGFHSCI